MRKRLTNWEERRLVYLGLLIACGVIALVAGPTVGLWGFMQAVLMIELASWLASHRKHLGSR